jgi:hypothetical protein
MTTTPDSVSRFKRVVEWLGLLALLVIVKAGFLIWDPGLRLFLGDSAHYLRAAMTEWQPPDRSFSYPWLVSVAVWLRSGLALVLIQTAMGIASCVLVFRLLRVEAGATFRVALLAATLVALEPAQLFYERMLMAEAAGLLVLLVFLAVVSRYVATGKLRWAALFVMAGLVVVSLRMSLLPVVLGLSAVAPLLRYAMRSHAGAAKVRQRDLLKHLLWVWAMLSGAHLGYQHLYGAAMGCAPAYLCNEAQMRLGLVATLVRPEHLAQVGLPVTLLDRLAYPIADSQNREAQMWGSGGLWKVLQHEVGEERARELGGRIASVALRSNLTGFVWLGLNTLRGYVNDDVAEARLADDAGVRRPDVALLKITEAAFGVDAVSLADEGVGRWFAIGRWWLPLALLVTAPLALLVLHGVWRSSEVKPGALVASTAALVMVAGLVLFSHIASFRYLHPVPVLCVLCGALLIGRGQRSVGAI